MANRKKSKKYYFSVEGETEEWYLLWLRDMINSSEKAAFKVAIDCKIEKDPLKRAKGLGKQIIYRFGYSNFAFDLWIVLHKADCNGALSHRKGYLPYINRAFGTKFQSMDEYKHEDNFKDCLKQLALEDVVKAVERSERIMAGNQASGYTLHNYKGFKYYKENPSLSVWEAVKEIMQDCKLLN